MKKTSLRLVVIVAAVFAATAISAKAGVINLTFENIAPYPNGNDVQIQNFYNGGTSSVGSSGPNYGISFPDNALVICLNTIGVSCSNTSRGGLGDPNSQLAGLFWLSGSSTFLDDPAGFTTGFSFNYAAPYTGGSIEVWSGVEGTGTLLASLSLPTTPSACSSDYDAGYCPFYPIGVGFTGTAESINFGGTANYIVFDDVTFGSSTPGNVPEPASLMLLGTGLVGVAAKLRRRQHQS